MKMERKIVECWLELVSPQEPNITQEAKALELTENGVRIQILEHTLTGVRWLAE